MNDLIDLLKKELDYALEVYRTSGRSRVTAGWVNTANPELISEVLQALESAQQRIAELEEEFAFIMGQNDEMAAKLATPVRLRPGSIWNSDPYNHGANDKYLECAAAVRAAGFKVEGDA